MHWYLVHTKPTSETTAEAHLRRQGYEVYVPRLVQAVRRGQDWREQVVPLFPRYLFLRLREGEQSLAPVRSSVGVSAVVRFGARYAIVPDPVIRDLHSRAHPDSGLHRLSAQPRLTPGAGVRITVGAFDGLEGVFEREAGADRVLVLLELLGQQTAVRVPTRWVVPACVA